MKNKQLDYLATILDELGFLQEQETNQDSSTSWFVSPSDDKQVRTYLRFIYKPKLSVLTMHIGWRHEPTHNFCMDVLESEWPRGYLWLSEAGVILAPCLTIFNLAEYMGWSLGGIQLNATTSIYKEEMGHLKDVIKGTDWGSMHVKSLLTLYIEDRKPFGWRASNSAIRLAQIAGLCLSTGENRRVFDQCALAHAALIESDMFALGTASSWIASLQKRLNNY